MITRPSRLLPAFVLGVLGLATLLSAAERNTVHKRDACWRVDDLRAGMKGYGRTVMKGTKIESFDVEVIGVLKNTSPGRDMVLCRLAGLGLEKTGVIAGMSGSPVYIDGKLVGAVAYAWAFGKEPIAGVTPFCQMHDYVEAYEKRDLVEQQKPTRIGLRSPLRVAGQDFESVTVSTGADPKDRPDDGLWMTPLQTPLVGSGFTPHSLRLMRDRFPGGGLVPMQGGGVSGKVTEKECAPKIEPGSALSVALITGDFDLSGIGTTTHVEGKRVYGWGHPFFGLGNCEFPLMTGYTHTIYPRQSVSFKIGSPVKTVGVINADVSTCIAGWLGRQPDMLPVKMTVTREIGREPQTFRVNIARQRNMLATLVYTVLTNSVDMEGELPDELTAELKTRIEIEGQRPVEINDTFSGSSFSGGRAPQALYSQVAGVINLLNFNSYRPVRIQKIECETTIKAGRRTADIEAVELDSETYAPGETVKGTVFLRPYKGNQRRVPVSLQLPADLPEGTYTATVCDDLNNARREIRDNPTLSNPQDLSQVLEALKVQTGIRRTNLVLRVPVNAAGVALNGKALPSLPPSMVQILANSRRTGAQTMGGALVSRHATEWVIVGVESVRFTVTKNRRIALSQ
jgi:hypothetical protein